MGDTKHFWDNAIGSQPLPTTLVEDDVAALYRDAAAHGRATLDGGTASAGEILTSVLPGYTTTPEPVLGVMSGTSVSVSAVRVTLIILNDLDTPLKLAVNAFAGYGDHAGDQAHHPVTDGDASTRDRIPTGKALQQQRSGVGAYQFTAYRSMFLRSDVYGALEFAVDGTGDTVTIAFHVMEEGNNSVGVIINRAERYEDISRYFTAEVDGKARGTAAATGRQLRVNASVAAWHDLPEDSTGQQWADHRCNQVITLAVGPA